MKRVKDWKDLEVTKEFLKVNPNVIFVFGDNILHQGYAGGASLRDEPNTYGFVTKRFPSNDSSSFYKPQEYQDIYRIEIRKLKTLIRNNPDKLFLISKIGSGLANRYKIFEKVIEPNIIEDLKEFENVRFLW